MEKLNNDVEESLSSFTSKLLSKAKSYFPSWWNEAILIWIRIKHRVPIITNDLPCLLLTVALNIDGSFDEKHDGDNGHS